MTYYRSFQVWFCAAVWWFPFIGFIFQYDKMTHICLVISLSANPLFLKLILLSRLADSDAALPTSGASQVYFATANTVVWHQLKCLLDYHGLQWTWVMSPLRWGLVPRCWRSPLSLEKKKSVGKMYGKSCEKSFLHQKPFRSFNFS